MPVVLLYSNVVKVSNKADEWVDEVKSTVVLLVMLLVDELLAVTSFPFGAASETLQHLNKY